MLILIPALIGLIGKLVRGLSRRREGAVATPATDAGQT